MTFCFFAAQYLPTVGGVERYTFNLARTLIQSGHKAIVVTSALPGLPAVETDENGICIYRFPCYALFGGRMPSVKKNAAFRRMAAQLAQQHIDFGVIQTRLYTLSAFGAKLLHKKGVPCLTIDHSTSHIAFGGAVVSFAGRLYEHWNTARIKRCCNTFYGVSAACGEWLRHFGIEACGALYNSVEPAQLEQAVAESKRDFRQGVPQGTFVVSFAGRLVKEKGVLKLIEAVNTLAQNGVNICLLVAGDGALMPQAQALAGRAVQFLGSLPHSDTMMLLAQSDVYCLPTDYPEGLPTGVLEAAALSCFVVTTTRGGSKELITAEDMGIILTENTSRTLAEALQKAMDKPYRLAAAQKTKQRLLADFTWAATAAKLAEAAQQTQK